jgi:hypothetical protein
MKIAHPLMLSRRIGCGIVTGVFTVDSTLVRALDVDACESDTATSEMPIVPSRPSRSEPSRIRKRERGLLRNLSTRRRVLAA